MKKFAISWISFHDNELKMKIVEAVCYESALEMAYHALTDVVYQDDDDEIKQAAFNCDGMIEALEIRLEAMRGAT